MKLEIDMKNVYNDVMNEIEKDQQAKENYYNNYYLEDIVLNLK